MATIYDPQELLITATVLPSTPPLTDIPNEAQITFPGFVAKPLSARLVRVKPQITPQQQGLELVYGMANPGGLIPVGLQAQATICVGQLKEVVHVPQSAVVQLNNRRLVYLQRAPEEFVKQFVEVEGEDGGIAYLRSACPRVAKSWCAVRQCLLSEEYKESIQLVEEGAEDRTPESGKPPEK